MTVDGFSLTKHSLSRRTESALKKKKGKGGGKKKTHLLSFLSHRSAILCLHGRVQMNWCRCGGAEWLQRSAPVSRGEAVSCASNQKVHLFLFSFFFFVMVQWGIGRVGGKCGGQMGTTVVRQLGFDPADAQGGCDGDER